MRSLLPTVSQTQLQGLRITEQTYTQDKRPLADPGPQRQESRRQWPSCSLGAQPQRPRWERVRPLFGSAASIHTTALLFSSSRHFPRWLLTGSMRKTDPKNPNPSGLGDTLVLFLGQPLSTSCRFLCLALRQETWRVSPSPVSALCRCPAAAPLSPPLTLGPWPFSARSSHSTPGPSPEAPGPALLSQVSALSPSTCFVLFYLRFSHLLRLVCLSL